MKRSIQLLAISTLAAAIAACGGSDSDSTASSGTGTVSFGITDAPTTNLANVTISFTGMALKPADGEWVEFTFDEPKSLNLLEYQGGASAPLITDEEVPAGQYSELRLNINAEDSDTDDDTLPDSFVITKDAPDIPKTLAVPSSVLKLNGDFLVAADTTTDFTIDFDVKKAIVDPQGKSLADFLLRPSLRLVNNLRVGAITGEVDFTIINQTVDCAADYNGSVDRKSVV